MSRRWFEQRLVTIHKELRAGVTDLVHQCTAGKISLEKLYEQLAELAAWAKQQQVATKADLARLDERKAGG